MHYNLDVIVGEAPRLLLFSLQPAVAPGCPQKKQRISIALSHFFPSTLTNICDCRDLGLPGAHDLILSAFVTETCSLLPSK